MWTVNRWPLALPLLVALARGSPLSIALDTRLIAEPCPLYGLAYSSALQNGAYHGWQSACQNNEVGSRHEPCTVMPFEEFFCRSASRDFTLEQTRELVRNASTINALSRAGGDTTPSKADSERQLPYRPAPP